MSQDYKGALEATRGSDECLLVSPLGIEPRSYIEADFRMRVRAHAGKEHSLSGRITLVAERERADHVSS